MKYTRLSKTQAEAFYLVHKERPFYGELVDYMIIQFENNMENINSFHLCSNTNPEIIDIAHQFIDKYDIKYYMNRYLSNRFLANPVIFEKNDLLTFQKIHNTYFF